MKKDSHVHKTFILNSLGEKRVKQELQIGNTCFYCFVPKLHFSPVSTSMLKIDLHTRYIYVCLRKSNEDESTYFQIVLKLY